MDGESVQHSTRVLRPASFPVIFCIMGDVNLASIEILGHTVSSLEEFFRIEFSKGAYHSRALFRHVYRNGNSDFRDIPEYEPAPRLADQVLSRLSLQLPEINAYFENDGTQKFTTGLHDGYSVESVVIPMSDWNTLCLSSQVGCGRACVFCETAGMGMVRNLMPEEIVAQWAVARFTLKTPLRNLVFMGMGEPFDNLDAVIRAIDILSDSRGAAIPKRRISLSTCGNVEGIRRLIELDRVWPDRAYRTLRLAVSLNAPNDTIRNRLMPINRTWPLLELKEALSDAPQSQTKDGLYFEYVLIPGVNDKDEHARMLLTWMDGLEAKINLIPYHPKRNSKWPAPEQNAIDRFQRILREGGRECRTRAGRGTDIAAACGMLATESR